MFSDYQPVISQQTYQGMSSGGPSPQAGAQPQPVQVLRPQVQSVPVPPTTQFVKAEPKKRAFALKIIDPSTNQEIAIDENSGNNNNITPTRSNDSSARETPQPVSVVQLCNLSTNSMCAIECALYVAQKMYVKSILLVTVSLIFITWYPVYEGPNLTKSCITEL